MAGKMLGTNIKSNKYIRNPRAKGWMLCKINNDTGRLECLADYHGCVDWNSSYGILWDEFNSPSYYLKKCKTWESYENEEVFIVRANSKNSPIVIDFKNPAYRANHRNVLFEKKCNKLE